MELEVKVTDASVAEPFPPELPPPWVWFRRHALLGGGREIVVRRFTDPQRVVFERADPVIDIAEELFEHFLDDSSLVYVEVDPSGEEDWSGTRLVFTDDEGTRLVYVMTGYDEPRRVFTARFPD
jgi:hypothetical protein